MHEQLTLLERYVDDAGNEAVSCGLGYSAGMGMWGASVDCPAARDFHVETDDCACESARGDTPGEALRALVDALGLVEGTCPVHDYELPCPSCDMAAGEAT